MPELPDVTVYVERLRARVQGTRLDRVRIASPFLVRSVTPRPQEAEGRPLVGVSRLGKRIVLELEGDLYLVLHLMIAGRLRWRDRGIAIPRRRGLAALDFEPGTVLFTEEGTKKRASMHVVGGRAGLEELDPGGVEVMGIAPDELRAALSRENHTLKRALTDPRILSGIGNAYSDEILHRARLSPFVLTEKLGEAELLRLHGAIQEVLTEWTDRLREAAGDGFPEKVTAFHPEMAVHGRYREPCPVCGDPIQRIKYADNETNYCATCQTGGRLLADRGLSRLLKKDWPRSLEELESFRRARQDPAHGPGDG
jgi:formamidopyrimidine-DNA glycosylase